MSDKIKAITAAFVLGITVIALLFQNQLGGGEPSAESYGMMGIIIGAAGQFLWNVAKKSTPPV